MHALAFTYRHACKHQLNRTYGVLFCRSYDQQILYGILHFVQDNLQILAGIYLRLFQILLQPIINMAVRKTLFIKCLKYRYSWVFLLSPQQILLDHLF